MHHRAVNFEVGDFVMARIQPERLPKNFTQKASCSCHGTLPDPPKLASNAYGLDLRNSLAISPTFIVEDLTLYRVTFEPPYLSFNVSIGTYVPRLPPLPQPHTDIEAMLDDEFVSSCQCGLCRFLVQQLHRP